MINLNIHKLDSFYTISNFEQHNLLKEKLLNLILKEDSAPLNYKDQYYNDTIFRCDWKYSSNFERSFVKEIIDPLKNHLLLVGEKLSYENIIINNIWYQQYKEGDVHGWHVHGGCQFTGVYYLDIPKNSPKTKIVTPINRKVITLEVKEGDILIMPSYLIHTSQKNKSENVKTIISFNFNYKNIFSEDIIEYNKYLK